MKATINLSKILPIHAIYSAIITKGTQEMYFPIKERGRDIGECRGLKTLIKGKSNLYPGGMARIKKGGYLI